MDKPAKTITNKKIALFGGSFDPIHNGHIAIVEKAIQAFDFDEVHLITAKQTPVQGKSSALDAEQRYELVKKVTDDLAQNFERVKFETPRLELDRQGVSYTCLTIKDYQAKYPGAELYWIMGEDSFRSLPKWEEFEYILSNVKLIIYPRKLAQGEQQPIDEQIQAKALSVSFLDAELIDISSTEIRQIVLERLEDKFKALVPNSIKDLLTDCYSK